jgi:hypothetical protein
MVAKAKRGATRAKHRSKKRAQMTKDDIDRRQAAKDKAHKAVSEMATPPVTVAVTARVLSMSELEYSYEHGPEDAENQLILAHHVDREVGVILGKTLLPMRVFFCWNCIWRT